jgi:hypothetical protein
MRCLALDEPVHRRSMLLTLSGPDRVLAAGEAFPLSVPLPWQ